MTVNFSRAENSVIVVGDGNTAIHVTIDGRSGYSARSASEPLCPRPLAVINPRDGREPVGRERFVTAATEALLAGRSVELCGGAGVGKTAIAEAVARRLAARRQPGILLGGGRRTELDELYTELAGVFFSTAWYTPDEAVLRAETARHRPSGVVVVPDCALSAPDADRLLGTFPDCRFLLCSRTQSLYSGPSVLDVPELGLDDALELVASLLGRRLAGVEELQVRQIHELGQGRVARLVVCAAFLQRAVADPRRYGTVPLEPRDQVAVLIAGLDEPARRALVALAEFGPAPADLFDALTGLEGAAAAAPKLEHAGLAVDRGGVLELADDDVRGVLAEHGSWRADPRVAADGLQPLLKRAGDERAPAVHARPTPALCVAVAEALVRAGDRDRAFAFARAAAPAALSAGRIRPWSSLVTIGLRTADGRKHGADLAYFLGERQTQALLNRDLVAAAAAFAALAAELARSAPPPSPAVSSGRGVRALHHTLKARHGTLFATTAVAVAGIVATGAVTGAALGAAVEVHSALRRGPQAATSSSVKVVTAAAYPYTVTDRPYITATSGPDSYMFQADYPSVSDLPNRALEQKINAELGAPLDQDAQHFAATNSGVSTAGGGGPGFYYITTSIYQVGSLISAQYAGSYHANGQGDVGYTIQTLTIRTDTGAEISNSALLAPAASTTDLDTLAADLQANRSISGCEVLDNSETLMEQALSSGVNPDSSDDYKGYAVNVTPGGLLFTFPAGEIGAEGCRPAAVLPWSELNGIVSTQIEQLAGAGAGAGGGGGGASASASPSASATAGPTPSATPADVVEAYYAAVNARDYRKAWDLGGSSLSPTYSSLVNGYAQVEQDYLTIDSESGDTVSVSLTASLFDGNSEQYVGSYTVSHGVIVSGRLDLTG